MTQDPIFTAARTYHERIFSQNANFFNKLAVGQSPDALMITCADSRIDPAALTNTAPGQLFVARNAGNFVPTPADVQGLRGGEAMTATLEYALKALNIPHLIVCGHSDCGAMKAAMAPGSADGLPLVAPWLNHAPASDGHGAGSHDALKTFTLENITKQLNTLRTFDFVAERLAAGTVQLHGWYYDIGAGQIEVQIAGSDAFLPAQEVYKSETGR